MSSTSNGEMLVRVDNVVQDAQKRCKDVQEHLKKALAALTTVAMNLEPGSSGSGIQSRIFKSKLQAVDAEEDYAFTRGLFEEIQCTASPEDSSKVELESTAVIAALNKIQASGDISPDVSSRIQELCVKHDRIDFEKFAGIVEQVPRKRGQRREWVEGLNLEQELLVLLQPGTWKDPLLGCRGLKAEEAELVSQRFATRLSTMLMTGMRTSDEDGLSSLSISAQELVEKLVGKLSVGDYFGEIALLCRKPRQATVKAVGKLTVLVLDREAFNRLCGNLEGILQRQLDSYSCEELSAEAAAASSGGAAAAEEAAAEEPIPPPAPTPARGTRARRGSVFAKAVTLEENWAPPEHPKTDEESHRLQEYLAKTALLCHLDSRTQQTVILAVQKMTFQVGGSIIEQGADGDFYYILDSGHADVFIKKSEAEGEKKVFEYSAGGAFGELALLHGEPRLATVRATQPCVCWALDRDTFRKIMMAAGKQSMNERTKFLSQVEILKGLAPFERFKIAEAMKTREFEEEAVVVREGDMGDEFFIIQSGSCSVFKLLPPKPAV